MRIKHEERSYQIGVEKDVEEIEYIIYSLLNSIYSNVIDIKSLKQFKKEISKFFDDLNK